MTGLKFIRREELGRLLDAAGTRAERLSLFSDCCRLNTLTEVKRAGSGHLGSSFSALDIVVALYLELLNVREVGLDSMDRDIFFSSKGHDVPGHYAVLYALGYLEEAQLMALRRLGGLDGHPDCRIPGMEACTGSLGMGISKAKGMAVGKRLGGHRGRVVVMTGDGELQEGQIWESVQVARQHDIDLTVIIDHNKIQTDLPVAEIIDVADLEEKFPAFGWRVARCDGHDFEALIHSIGSLMKARGPGVLIADTIKGKGVSFMEQISAMSSAKGKYLWHSGAPKDDDYQSAVAELMDRIQQRCQSNGIRPPEVVELTFPPAEPSTVTREYVAAGYGEELVRLGEHHPELVVLDGDLAADCRVRAFQEVYPERFIENGIAEQDMVSTAGGLALQGFLPVVNSFASFLSSRANEQIYNNACEGRRVIYAGHFAGMIPAGPGKSHQSVRDISLFVAIPNMVIAQPACAAEAKQILRFAVERCPDNCVIRMNIGPSPRQLQLPGDYRFEIGRGWCVREGMGPVVFTYGAVMIHEVLCSAELLAPHGVDLRVMHMSGLNRIDSSWLRSVLAGRDRWYVVEDHMRVGGLGDALMRAFGEMDDGLEVQGCIFGLDVLPACGTPREVLRHHGLDGGSLARRIAEREGVAAAAEELDSGYTTYQTLEAAQ